jgi:hypothetical protein
MSSSFLPQGGGRGTGRIKCTNYFNYLLILKPNYVLFYLLMGNNVTKIHTHETSLKKFHGFPHQIN